MGPAVAGEDNIERLIRSGMNVARLNFSHGTQEDHARVIQDLKAVRARLHVPLAIMLDTKGPEIRLGMMANGHIAVEAGQKVWLTKENVEGSEHRWTLCPDKAVDALEEGMRILFDDGYLIGHVLEKKKDEVLVEILNGGVIRSQKGVNIPGASVDLPAMTERDIQDIIFGCQLDIDLIAASFIRSQEHIQEIKALLAKQGKSNVLVFAKIENILGVNNFAQIVDAADGIMVARGDLGVEMPLEQVPTLQKMMIHHCYRSGKPVVTATQMLESMIKNPRPTRAEVSDVANAIYDGTSAIMLSGETAMGQYPQETVSMMRSIADETEKQFEYRDFFYQNVQRECTSITSSVALAAVKTAYSTGAAAIFAFTDSGFTARFLSSFRPKMPIVACTGHIKVYHQLALQWGVIPAEPTQAKTLAEAFAYVSAFALERGLVKKGDLVVVTGGAPFGVQGTTNMICVETIGHVIGSK